MFVTRADMESYVAEQVRKRIAGMGLQVRGGTVVTSPAEGDATLSVVMDGSAIAVEVKLAGLPVFRGDRVTLVEVGSDWTCIGAFGAGAVTFTDPVTMTGPLTLAGDQVAASGEGINAQAVTSGQNDTTSATFVDMAGTGSITSFSFIKRFADTRVKVEFSFDFYTITAGADAMVGVRINGVDYDIRRAVGVLNQHQSYTATRRITGIPAGTYTVQCRWYRASGTGTCRRDAGDWLSVSAEEVAA